MVHAFSERNHNMPTWRQLEHAILRNFGGLDRVQPVEVFGKYLHSLDKKSPVCTRTRSFLSHCYIFLHAQMLIIFFGFLKYVTCFIGSGWKKTQTTRQMDFLEPACVVTALIGELKIHQRICPPHRIKIFQSKCHKNRTLKVLFNNIRPLTLSAVIVHTIHLAFAF